MMMPGETKKRGWEGEEEGREEGRMRERKRAKEGEEEKEAAGRTQHKGKLGLSLSW